MDVRLSSAALRDLAEAVAFVAAENPEAAQRLQDRVFAAATRLGDFPALGARIGDRRRVFSVPGTRFRLIYETRSSTVFILRIYHGARAWPPAEA